MSGARSPSRVVARTTIAATVLAVIIGPVLFVFARTQALESGFQRVKVGDTVPAVRKAMGAPGEERHAVYLQAETEYRYWVWPLPGMWVVGFAGDKVVDKAKLRSP
jgi:hypothetical protein